MSARNLVVMFGAMTVLRRIDQEEPLVLLYSRIAYLAYVAFTAIVYTSLHFRIIAARDTSLLTIPAAKKPPSISETWQKVKDAAEKAEREAEAKALAEAGGQPADEASTSAASASGDKSKTKASVPDDAADETENDEENDDDENDDDEGAVEEEPKDETITTMEYDLRQLATSRRSWITSTMFLAIVHYHMQSVNPLVMSCVMGLARLISEDPLVQIHLRAAPAVEKLARPFAAEKSPFAAMLNEMTPKTDASAETDNNSKDNSNSGSGLNATSRTVAPAGATEDLHDDGDDEDEDDAAPIPVADHKDDHIKSDFDDEDDEDEASKKDQ